MRRLSRWLGVFCLLCLFSASAFAYDGLVKKEHFILPVFTMAGGRTIKNVQIGYESYGKLNAKHDNVILITHYFSGTSHAAGKYQATDKAPGYWDAIIGSGKAIDTDKYFVLASDALTNLNSKDPNTFTTGPASINPDTGKPYGLTFPVVTVEDMVVAQKALLDNLGIKSLVAVAGASGGAAQALQWGVTFPDVARRIIAVVPFALDMQPITVAEVSLWSMPIMLDPKWNGGDYYDKEAPLTGLAHALRVVTFSGVSQAWAEKNFGRRSADPKAPVEAALVNNFAVDAALIKAGMNRATSVDANNFLYTAKAYELFSVVPQIAKFKADILLIPVASDKLFPPSYSRRAVEQLHAAGKHAEVFVLESDGGHLDGVTHVSVAEKAIRDLLKRPALF
jgi:homoserine O-acetyltransferase